MPYLTKVDRIKPEANTEPVKKRDDTRIEVLTFAEKFVRSFYMDGWKIRYSAINKAGEDVAIIVPEGSDADRVIRNELEKGHKKLRMQITTFKTYTNYVCLGKG